MYKKSFYSLKSFIKLIQTYLVLLHPFDGNRALYVTFLSAFVLVAILVVECFVVLSIAPDFHIRSLVGSEEAATRQLIAVLNQEAPDFTPLEKSIGKISDRVSYRVDDNSNSEPIFIITDHGSLMGDALVPPLATSNRGRYKEKTNILSTIRIEKIMTALLDIAREIKVTSRRLIDFEHWNRNETVIKIKEYLAAYSITYEEYNVIAEKILDGIEEDDAKLILVSILLSHVVSLRNFEEGLAAPCILSTDGREKRIVRFALTTESEVKGVVLKSPTFAPAGLMLKQIPSDASNEQLKKLFESDRFEVEEALREGKTIWRIETSVPHNEKQVYSIEDESGNILIQERVIWPSSVDEPLINALIRGILEGDFADNIRMRHRELIDMVETWMNNPPKENLGVADKTYDDLLKRINRQHHTVLLALGLMPIFISKESKTFAATDIIQHELSRGLEGVVSTADTILRMAKKGEVFEVSAERPRWEIYKNKLLNFLNPKEFALEPDKLDFADGYFPARRILEALEEKYRNAMNSGGIDFEVDTSRLPEVVYLKGQFFWMLRALTRFISNAEKFTSEGFNPEAKIRRVQIIGNAAGDKVQFVFKDTGIGIPEEDLRFIRSRIGNRRIFRATNAKGIPGTGTAFFGAAAMLIEKFGAEVEIDSKEGQGTTVTVWFPLAQQVSIFDNSKVFVEIIDDMFGKNKEEVLVSRLKEISIKFDEKIAEEKRRFAASFLYAIEQMQGQLRNIQFSVSAGGRATNVAHVLEILGVCDIPWIGFVGQGNIGGKFIQLLPKTIKPNIVSTKEDTRVYIGLYSSPDIRLKTPAQVISRDEWMSYLNKYKTILEEAKEGQWVIMGGSVVQGDIPEEVYAELIRLAKAKGLYICLDVHEGWSDKRLLSALSAQPTMLKFNRDEFQKVLDLKYPGQYEVDKLNPQQISNLAEEIAESYDIELIIVSLDKDGAVLITGEESYYASFKEKVSVYNSIGVGDALVGGFILSVNKRLSLGEALKKGVAVATAMVRLGMVGMTQASQEDIKVQIDALSEYVEVVTLVKNINKKGIHLSKIKDLPPICVNLGPSVDLNLFYIRYENLQTNVAKNGDEPALEEDSWINLLKRFGKGIRVIDLGAYDSSFKKYIENTLKGFGKIAEVVAIDEEPQDNGVINLKMEDTLSRYGSSSFDIVVLNRPCRLSPDPEDRLRGYYILTEDNLRVQIDIARQLVREGGLVVIALSKNDISLDKHAELIKQSFKEPVSDRPNFVLVYDAEDAPNDYAPSNIVNDVGAVLIFRREVLQTARTVFFTKPKPDRQMQYKEKIFKEGADILDIGSEGDFLVDLVKINPNVGRLAGINLKG